MTTVQWVRLCLQHHRSCGEPFAVAWTRALRSIPRGADNEVVKRDRREWDPILRWARPHFQAAYELRELGPAEVTLLAAGREADDRPLARTA